jgi:hypothetical protein
MPQVGDGRGKQGVSGKTSTFNNVEERNIYFEQLRVKLKEGMERIDAEKAAWDSVLQWRNEHDLPF